MGGQGTHPKEAATGLFSRLRLRSIDLANRIVVSPMSQYSSPGEGMVGDWHMAHYAKLAMGGPGLVMVESTAVARDGRITYGDLGAWSDNHVPGLARLAELIRAMGAVPGIQLGHAGRKASSQRPWHGNGPLGTEDVQVRGESPWEPVGPTDEPASPGAPAPRALSMPDLREIAGQWKAAAVRALRAGFEVAEIHGAHGYLIHSFLSPLSNTRSDAYGADLAGRIRFALEVTQAVRDVWPVHLPLFFRISAVDASKAGWNIGDSVALAKALKPQGVDIVDCSSGGIGQDYSVIPRGLGFQTGFASEIRRSCGIGTMAVGLIVDPVHAEKIIADGDADLAALGREILVNPNWPLLARQVLHPTVRFGHWPVQSGWWLDRRKVPVANASR